MERTRVKARVEWYSRSPTIGCFGLHSPDGQLLAQTKTHDEDGLCHVLALAPELLAACETALAALDADNAAGAAAVLRRVLTAVPATQKGRWQMAPEIWIIKVTDFSETPGARYRNHGPHSGEEFRDDVLVPAFERAVMADATLLIDLDGGYGYPPGFLEEAFGGLARQFGKTEVASRLEFKSEEELSVPELIREYVAKCDG